MFNKASWSELFAKHDFFHKYRYYLQVIASTGAPEMQIKWYVFCAGSHSIVPRLHATSGPGLWSLEYDNSS